MFTQSKTILLQATDATGTIYFPFFLIYAQQALEEAMLSLGHTLPSFFAQGLGLPIVHVEADYHMRVTLGETLQLHFSIENIGNSSFSTRTLLYNHENILVGSIKIVHVCLFQEKTTPIPPFLHTLLEKI